MNDQAPTKIKLCEACYKDSIDKSLMSRNTGAKTTELCYNCDRPLAMSRPVIDWSQIDWIKAESEEDFQ
jgi:hypothetical protein